MGKSLWKPLLTLMVIAAFLWAGIEAIHGWEKRKRSDTAAAASIDSGYLGSITARSAVKLICVVFVHGVFGDDTTWGKGKITLPKLLMSDDDLSPMIDEFFFEYSSPYLHNASKIADLSEQLRGDMDDNRVWEDHRKIIFVAHSMGGLIVRQFLSAHRAHAQQVAMMYFYAVPTDGAIAAEVAKKASGNPQLEGMIPLEGNDFLTSVRDNWTSSDELKNIITYCAFEELDTYNLLRIVPQSSASALCTATPDPMNADHIMIVKPASSTDRRFTRLDTAIKKSLGMKAISDVQITAASSGKEGVPSPQSSEIVPSPQSLEVVSSPESSEPPVDNAKAMPPSLDPRWMAFRTSDIENGPMKLHISCNITSQGTDQKRYGDCEYSEIVPIIGNMCTALVSAKLKCPISAK